MSSIRSPKASYNSLEEMISSVASGVRPPVRMKVSEAAEKFRFLNNTGSYVGYWDNTIAPYLVEPMDTLTGTDYIGMIFAGPARTGKSDMFFNWLIHTAITDPADMMHVMMTKNVARDWSSKDLLRAFRHSVELGKTVSPGKNNQTTHDIRFKSGMHLLVKWPTASELSGKTVGRNWISDYDRIPESIDGEGNAYDLTAKRATTFRRHGMTVAESSPGYDISDPTWTPQSPHEAPPTKGILSLYNRGDRRRWYWKCPHCSVPFEPDFNLLIIPDSRDHIEAAEATVMACPHCGGVIHHDGRDGVPGKNELNQIDLGNAKWVRDGQIWVPGEKEEIQGEPFRSDIASFWLKGPAAAFTTWRDLALKYLKAQEEYERTGSQEALKTTTNTDQGLPYMPKALERDRAWQDIKDRALPLPQRRIPDTIRFLVATIDVQKYRFEVQVQGFDENSDITVIDRFALTKSNRKDEDGDVERIAPATYEEDWDILIEEVISKRYPLAKDPDKEMGIRAFACDSGGAAGDDNDSSATKNAYMFWRKLRNLATEGTLPSDIHHRFKLVKGASTKNAPRVVLTYPDSERKDRKAGARGEIPVLMINTTALKDQTYAILDKITFPDWLPDEVFAELVAESRSARGWVRVAKRNETWDLLVYAVAVSLSDSVQIERIDWSRPPSWAREHQDNTLVFDKGVEGEGETSDKENLQLEDLGALLT